MAINWQRAKSLFLPSYLLQVPQLQYGKVQDITAFIEDSPDTAAAFAAKLADFYWQIEGALDGEAGKWPKPIGLVLSPRSILEQIAVFAQTWCSNLTDEETSKAINSGVANNNMLESMSRLWSNPNVIYQWGRLVAEEFFSLLQRTGIPLPYVYCWSVLGDPEDKLFDPTARVYHLLGLLSKGAGRFEGSRIPALLDWFDNQAGTKTWREASKTALFQTIGSMRWLDRMRKKISSIESVAHIDRLAWYIGKFSALQVFLSTCVRAAPEMLFAPELQRTLLTKVAEFIPILVTSSSFSGPLWNPALGDTEEAKRYAFPAMDGRSCLLSASVEDAVNFRAVWNHFALVDQVCSVDLGGLAEVGDCAEYFGKLGIQLLLHDL